MSGEAIVLNNKQIQVLANLSDFELVKFDELIVGLKLPKTYKPIMINYEEFRAAMGLEGLRFHWLCGATNMLAGGSVLDWIEGRTVSSDWDFFFNLPESTEMFKLMAETYGFVSTHLTDYALTCFHPEEYATIQIVGYGHRSKNLGYYDSPAARFFGTPQEVTGRFDLTLCRFAVDADCFYTDTMAIRDLITRSIRLGLVSSPNMTAERVIKYAKKNYYLPQSVFDLKEKPNALLKCQHLPTW
jgi:hypothetical protein